MLEKARSFECQKECGISEEMRPVAHLTPRCGWMNDPNGFSFYDGACHLFYQYYPYDINWGPMHWGHAVTKDLISWEYLPCAMAPDREYEDGCYSGTAVSDDTYGHLLMYTAHHNDPKLQRQCIANGDGLNYTKWEENPVITADDLPDTIDPGSFRDPKLFYEKGHWNCLTVAKDREGMGHVLHFVSDDLKKWTFGGFVLDSDKAHGAMWECPDLFTASGKQILCVSCEELPVTETLPGGHQVLFFPGSFDMEKSRFLPDADFQMPDIGPDFYAPETVQMPDGRTVLIGWLQNWDNRRDPKSDRLNTPKDFPWAGMMTVPREVTFQNGQILMQPVHELEEHLTDPVKVSAKLEADPVCFDGICGRCLDLKLCLKTDGTASVTVSFAADGDYRTDLVFDAAKGTLTLDRSSAGMDCVFSDTRIMHLGKGTKCLDVRILLDRFSAEIFEGEGAHVMTASLFTPQEASGIFFSARGEAELECECRKIVK